MCVQEPPDSGLQPQALPRHMLAHPPGKFPSAARRPHKKPGGKWRGAGAEWQDSFFFLGTSYNFFVFFFLFACGGEAHCSECKQALGCCLGPVKARVANACTGYRCCACVYHSKVFLSPSPRIHTHAHTLLFFLFFFFRLFSSCVCFFPAPTNVRVRRVRARV